jgi:hypothetical protein
VHLGLGEGGAATGSPAGVTDVELVVTPLGGEAHALTVPAGSRAALGPC